SARASLLLNLTDKTNVGHIPLPLVARDAETAVDSPPGAHQAAVWAYVMAAGETRPIIVEPPDSAAISLAIRWRPRDPAEPLIVMANDDMVMLTDAWDRQLRGLLSRPEVGAVGTRLLYPDGTVQHAGIMLGWNGGDVHDGRHEASTEAGPGRRWHVTRAVSAATGAFLAIRRETFLAHGGFDAAGLPIAHSDIDLALKLRSSGLK